MKSIISLFFSLFFLYSCNTDSPSGDNWGSDFKAAGAAEPLSQAEFDALPPIQQYQVANKLLSMIQKGISVDEFFDISGGTDTLIVKNSNFIENLRTQIRRPLSSGQKANINYSILGDPGEDNGKYRFGRDRDFHRQLPIAKIMEYPISRDSFAAWAAHFLANTIMFSPAFEMDSTDAEDIQFIMTSLEGKIQAGVSVRSIIAQHLPTRSRWRVSRSAENHALEAMELYLGLFADEAYILEDIESGGKACQEWYLTDNSEGYELRRTGLNNTEPFDVLDDNDPDTDDKAYRIVDCNDFHAAIAQHPNLLPRVTTVIVDYLLNGRDGAVRTAVRNAIVDSGATTFEDIFKGVLFSKEFLLNTERPVSYENNFLSMLDRLRARPVGGTYSRFVLDNFIGSNTGNQINLRNMGWQSGEYKIGRPQNVPIDALSFASHHKAMREGIFGSSFSWYGGPRDENDRSVNHVGLIYEAYDGNDDDTDLDDTRVKPNVAALSIQQYLDYLFITALSRKPNTDEQADLIAYFNDPQGGGVEDSWLREDSNNPGIFRPRDNFRYRLIAEAVFDYISRLEEFYYIRTVPLVN